MQRVFSTAGLHPRDSFKRWQEMLFARGAPIEQQRLDESPFEATLEIAQIGPLAVTRVARSALRSESTPGLIRRFGKDEGLMISFQITGTSTVLQGDRTAVQSAGDLVVINHRPCVLTTSAGSQSLFVELSRERLESVLGPTQLYSALTVGADLAATTLTARFFQGLIPLRRNLDPDAAARMASIGIDLIVASIAERLALEVPRSLHGGVVVQRAKAYVEDHLSDPALDPPRLAAAVGVSLRRLQELFHEHGQPIADWIWQRRLEVAAKRLTDPDSALQPIGTLALESGFASQAHFSRRFKERHGMTPRDYRVAASLGTPTP